MVYLLLALGLVLLVAGGDVLVRGAVATAGRLGVSPMLIGLTVVGFGTSTPELVTSLEAAFRGSPGIAVGNVVGSNIANILLILGIAALLWPVACDPRAIRRDGAVMTAAAVAVTAAAFLGEFGRGVGAAFVAVLLVYIAATYLVEKRTPQPSGELHAHEVELAGTAPKSLWLALLMTFGGIGLTVLGARFLVSAAIDMARDFGVSETVIGLTVVAVGTSLPELVTSVMAALKRHSDIALGNIIGSNIFNVFGILGLTALIHPLAVPPEVLRLDLWVMLGATVLCIALAYSGGRVSRIEGGLLLAGYVGYVGVLAAGV